MCLKEFFFNSRNDGKTEFKLSLNISVPYQIGFIKDKKYLLKATDFLHTKYFFTIIVCTIVCPTKNYDIPSFTLD